VCLTYDDKSVPVLVRGPERNGNPVTALCQMQTNYLETNRSELHISGAELRARSLLIIVILHEEIVSGGLLRRVLL